LFPKVNSQWTTASPDSEGILLVSEQRPATDFPELDDDQFKQYIYGTFGEVIQELMTFKSAWTRTLLIPDYSKSIYAGTFFEFLSG
jgi:hypothetical protein